MIHSFILLPTLSQSFSSHFAEITLYIDKLVSHYHAKRQSSPNRMWNCECEPLGNKSADFKSVSQTIRPYLFHPTIRRSPSRTSVNGGRVKYRLFYSRNWKGRQIQPLGQTQTPGHSLIVSHQGARTAVWDVGLLLISTVWGDEWMPPDLVCAL